jgi:hypothetical protein
LGSLFKGYSFFFSTLLLILNKIMLYIEVLYMCEEIDLEKTYPCLNITRTKENLCHGTVKYQNGKFICGTCGDEASHWSLEYAEAWRRGDYHDYIKKK